MIINRQHFTQYGLFTVKIDATHYESEKLLIEHTIAKLQERLRTEYNN